MSAAVHPASWRAVRSEFRLQCLAALEQRTAALAGIATQGFFGVLRMAVFDACFAAVPAATLPLGAAATRDYVWLSQALIMMIFLRLDPELANAVRSGSIANELLRPGDPWPRWFARLCARRLVATALRGAPLVALALALGWLHPPASLLAGTASLLSMLLAVGLASALILALTMWVFWSITGDGLELLLVMGAYVLGGLVLPLPFFPDWLQPLIAWLPFRGLLDSPARLWAGVPPGEIPGILLHQLGWIVALTLLGRLALRHGLRRLTIMGG